MLMSVPPATEMFQFAGFASRPYQFRSRYPGASPGWVAPFGNPGITDRSHLPRAFRSVPRPSSPLSAKASTRCPSLALDCHHAARAQGQNPDPASAGAEPPRQRGPTTTQAASHEDTSLGHNPARSRLACPPRSHDNSLFTLQSTPAPAELDPARSATRLAPRQTPVLAGLLTQPLPRGRNRVAPVVEVNGFEPMTSCLQSRRSPS